VTIRLRLSEKANPRYLHINPDTNIVELIVPISSGFDIALDNTCQTLYALQEFFGKCHNSDQLQNSARHELLRYRYQLQADIRLMADGEDKRLKMDRLSQVEEYIHLLQQLEAHPDIGALTDVYPGYPASVKSLINKRTSNIYGMLLRPTMLDNALHGQNYVFTMDRASSSGTLYHALHGINLAVMKSSPNELLRKQVLDKFKGKDYPIKQGWAELDVISSALADEYKKVFPGQDVPDFVLSADDRAVYAYDEESEIGKEEELHSIVDALIATRCGQVGSANSVFSSLTMPLDKEKLSLMVQAFLGTVNIYAKARNLTQVNFGSVLDRDNPLAQSLASAVQKALEEGESVEQAIVAVIGRNLHKFGLTTNLDGEQIKEVIKRFTYQYELIKGSPHFDEFMVLEPEFASQGGFYTHQNGMGFSLAALIEQTPQFSHLRLATTQRAYANVTTIPGEVPLRDAKDVGLFDFDVARYKREMSRHISENNYHALRLLFSVTEEGQCLLDGQDFDREYFKQFDHDVRAQQVFRTLRKEITDAKLLNLYNKTVLGLEASVLLTPDMCRALYVAAQSTRELSPKQTLKYSTVDDVKLLLEGFGIGNFEGHLSFNNDIQIDTTADSAIAITSLIERYKNSIHITQSMLASLYKQVAETCGTGSAEYKEMQRLNNVTTPDKFCKALALLNIQFPLHKIGYSNNGIGRNGYIISELGSDALRTILQIHEVQSNKMVLAPYQVNNLCEAIRKLNPSMYNSYLASITDVSGRTERLQMALALLGITFRNPGRNPDGGSVIYLDAAEQSKVKLILGYELTLDEKEMIGEYQPEVSNGNEKSPRSRLISQLEQRARNATPVRREQADVRRPVRPVTNERPRVVDERPRVVDERPTIPRRGATQVSNPAQILPVMSSNTPIKAIVKQLITNISGKENGRAEWFSLNTDPKLDKLRVILRWLDQPRNANLNIDQEASVLALIRDVSAIKRNPFGLFAPHSLKEFESIISGNSVLRHYKDGLSDVKYSGKDLDWLTDGTMDAVLAKGNPALSASRSRDMGV
jgi:hypothetical protein